MQSSWSPRTTMCDLACIRSKFFFPFDGQDAHGQNCPRCSLLLQCAILAQSDVAVGVHTFNELLILVEAAEPHFLDWVVVG